MKCRKCKEFPTYLEERRTVLLSKFYIGKGQYAYSSKEEELKLSYHCSFCGWKLASTTEKADELLNS